MANTIRIKRRAAGVGNGAPSGLANAELAYNEGDNILYYGFGTGGVGGTATQVIAIAGGGAYLNKNNNLSDLNNTQISRNNLVDGTVTSGLFMRGNGTNVLMGSILASDVPVLNQNTTGNAATVTNGVYTNRTLTAGSGLVGGGDFSIDRTFDINTGDGIQIASDAVAVDSTVVRTARTITVAGTTNQITSSAGAQDLSANRTWTLSLPQNIHTAATPTFGGLTITGNISGRAPSSTNAATQIIVFSGDPSSTTQAVLTRTPTQLLSDIGAYSSSNPNGYTTNVGTVTSVAALTIGTTGTDVSSAVATSTTTPVITLNIPTASASNRGALSSTDWSTFNGKAAANQTMFIGTTSVTINRSSASLSLAGVSIDGNAGTVTSGVYTSGSYADPTWISSLAKSKVGLGNVTNDIQVKQTAGGTTVGYVPIWNSTSGELLAAGYSVETTLAGSSSSLPRADAVKTYVDNLLGANDAMVFKGTIGTGGTVTALPTTHQAGWAYRVITAATYAGKACEIGDLLIAIVDRSGSSNTDDDWTAVQTNLDGAVIGPASSTTNALAVFNGTTGKLIQNSSFVPTTVGGNLINLTNPSAIRFVRINADNSVSSLSDTDFRTAIGAGTSSTVGTVTAISAGNGMNYSPITTTGNIVLGTPSSITLSSTNSVTSTSHTHAFSPGGTTSEYIRGDGAATSGGALTKTDDTNVTLTIGGSPTNALLSATSLALGWTGNLAANRGGTGQTTYASGELLIGNASNTLTKATLTQGANVTITNGNGSITIAATDTNTATAADDILDGSNTGTQITYAPYATSQAASASPRFYNTADNPSGSGRLNVSAYFYATRLFDNGSRVVTASTICADAGNCTWDGGDF